MVPAFKRNVSCALDFTCEYSSLFDKPAEIADMLGIERTYWSRFEGGKRAVSDEVAYLLTERFGVTLDFLILGKWDKLPLDVATRLRAVAGPKNA